MATIISSKYICLMVQINKTIKVLSEQNYDHFNILSKYFKWNPLEMHHAD